MNESLVVDVNHEGMHTLGVPAEFSTSGSFDVRLRNRGEATHVHLKLDDALSGHATLEEGHHYVTKGDTQVVHVTVADDTRGTGTLEVTTGHGGTTKTVAIELGAEPDKPPVEIDESLTEPRVHTEERQRETGGSEAELVPAVALGGVAVLLALSTLTTGGTAAIVLGLLAAASALGAAAYVYTNRTSP